MLFFFLLVVDQQGGLTFVDMTADIEESSESRPTNQYRSPRAWERYFTGYRPIATISIFGDLALTAHPNPYPTKPRNANSMKRGDTM